MTAIKVSAFKWVPPFAQGLVRDLRVRWALEEAGLPYEEALLALDEQKSESYRAWQPFGQIPAYQEDGLSLFESGAIVLHIAQRSDALMPTDPQGRARTVTWMFAALNTVEPPITYLDLTDIFYADAPWAKQCRPVVLDMVMERLKPLSERLSMQDYLEDRFTAADLLMITVLRNLRHTDILSKLPALDAYQQRCEARPAFRKALSAQTGHFARNAPEG